MRLLSRLLPQPLPSLIKIAGTNGKGSVAAMLSQVLVHDGQKSGMFTSPHLWSVQERFVCDGRLIEAEVLEELAAEWKGRLLPLIQQKPDLRPSFFEILLLLALAWWQREGVVLGIVEAGIGGYRDATSGLPDVLGIITSIGLDHCEALVPEGHPDSLAAIATNKTGIVQPGGTLVVSVGIGQSAHAALLSEAARRRVTVLVAEEATCELKYTGPQGQLIKTSFGHVNLPLAGHHQMENFRTLQRAVGFLVEKKYVQRLDSLKAIEHTVWPGRAELQGSFLLDVAHNPQALGALCRLVRVHYPHAKRLLYGVAADKDTSACVKRLAAFGLDLVLVGGFYRAMAPEELSQLIGNPVVVGRFETPKKAVAALGGDGLTVVTGSVFLIGAVRAALGLYG